MSNEDRVATARKGTAFFFLVMMGTFGSQAIAQTASEITPETFQPDLQRLNGAIVFTGDTGTEAPAGSEQIGITLSGVNLQDGLSEMTAANAAFETRLTRGRIPVSELFEATADLEAAYANAGFVLARVVLPQQTLNDGGRLKVTVVNGFIEAIDATGVAPETRARLETLTAPLVNQRSLTRGALERQLLLAGDVPGVALQTALAAGQQEGGAVIALDPEFKPVTGFVGLGNPFGDELGHVSLNMGVEVNSPFHLGETIYARLSGAPDGFLSQDPLSRVMAVGAVVPLGGAGMTMNYEYTQSETTPRNGPVPTQSFFERQSLRLAYPFVRSRELNVTGQVSLDLQKDSQSVIGAGAIYMDQTSVLRMGGNVSKIHKDGATTNFSATLSRGIDAFDARLADTVGVTPLSRLGADATFSKLNGSFSHRRSLAEKIGLSVAGQFQTSFGDPLLVSEQFSLIGPSALSSFDSGAVRGDSGWVVRAEVSTQTQANIGSLPVVISPYVFVGAGRAIVESATAVQATQVDAFSYGLGADIFSVSESNFRSSSLRIEIGKGDDGETDDTRFSIAANFRF